MPRFTIKDLLLTMCLFAIGLCLLIYAYHHPNLHAGEPIVNWPVLIGWFGGGAFIGAALFMPFRHPLLGLMVGALVQVLLVAIASFW
jgi:hypothetical protein